MKTQTNNKGSSTKRRRLPIFVLALCIVVIAAGAIVGSVFSKYLSDYEKHMEMTSEVFYFESDFLVKDGQELPVYTTEGYFQLFNNDRSDTSSTASHKTKDTITYTVSAVRENASGVSNVTLSFVGDESGDSATTLTNTESIDKFTFTGAYGDRVTVTARSTAPYEKELKCTFVFSSPTKDSYYDVEDRGYYLILRLYMGENSINLVSGDNLTPTQLSIDYGNGLMLDTASPGIDKDKFTAENKPLKVNVQPNSYFEIILYKESNNHQIYTKERTMITDTNGVLSLKIEPIAT